MSLNHSPSIVLSNLELNLDFKNPKLFSNTLGTNLVPSHYYDPSNWGNTFQKQVTAGIDAPDGSKNAVRITPRVYSGTYTITSNVATVKISDHQLNNSNIYLDFTSGGGVDNFYTITKVDDDTFTANVTAANTSGSVTAYPRTGLRITFPAFTPNGTDRYTIGFWVRLVEGTFLANFNATADLNDGVPSFTYTSQLVQGKWVYVTFSGVPTATSKAFIDLASDYFGTAVLDFWGLKIENQTADNTPIPVNSSFGNYSFSLYRPEYAKFEDGYITFDRTTSPAPKWGGVALATGTGNLTSSNFLYNDHTWEVWFRINDRTPEGSTNEPYSCLALYNGYHSGFIYTASSMQYIMWNGTTTQNSPCAWTVGTSTAAQIVQGQWYQIVVTRNNDTYTPYLNGVQSGNSGTFATPTINTSIANTVRLGGAEKTTPGSSNYMYYSRNSVANMKMYSRALSAAEVAQNFNALRGRFGL